MCLIAHKKVVRQVWIFNQCFLKMEKKIVSIRLCSDHSKNAQFEICMGEDSSQYAGLPNTPVRHALLLYVFTCRSPQTAVNGNQNSSIVLGCTN